MEYYCPICKREMIIGGQEMESQTQDEYVAPEDDRLITNAHCPHCNAEVMVWYRE